jgi:hypothetical protein
MVVGGIFWTIAYLLIIRQGFKDKMFGMPMAACAQIFLGKRYLPSFTRIGLHNYTLIMVGLH